MKKFVGLFLSLTLLISPVGFCAWDKSSPAGSSNASDIDSNVMANNTALEGILDQTRGWKNLKVIRNSANQVTVTADVLFLQTSGSIAGQYDSVSEVIDITSSGASGLDTSTEAISTWYYVWIIAKSSDGTINGLLSASSSSPTMPSGYDQKTLVSAVRNNSSGDFVNYTQTGLDYIYTSWQTIASGNLGGSWSSVDTSSYVPSALSNYTWGSVYHNSGGWITNDSSVVTGNGDAGNKFWFTSSVAGYWAFSIVTSNTLYAASDNAGFQMRIEGFRINKHIS